MIPANHRNFGMFSIYLGCILSYSPHCAMEWPNWRNIIHVVDQTMVIMSSNMRDCSTSLQVTCVPITFIKFPEIQKAIVAYNSCADL